MFALVHFTENDEVEVVPGSWVKGTTCKWPKVPSHKARQLISKGAPLTGPCDDYKVIVKGLFATYKEASEKLDIVQYTSDINTDSGAEPECRKRRLPQRLVDDDTEVLTQGRTKRRRPLPDDSDSECDGGAAPTPAIAPPTIPDAFPQSSVTGENSSAPDAPTKLQNNCRQRLHQPVKKTQYIRTPEAAESQTALGLMHRSIIPHAEFQQQVLRLLHIIRLTQQNHGDVLQEICAHNIRGPDVEKPAPLVAAPFMTAATLEEFNASLNEQRQSLLVDEFSHIGGTDIQHATRSTLSYLLTDAVAAEYSWLGQKGKKKFSLLKFPALIFQALRKNKKLGMATRAEVEAAIKSWLRHAKERTARVPAEERRSGSEESLVIHGE